MGAPERMNEVGLRQSGGLISAVLAEKTARSAEQRPKTADHHAANRRKFNNLRKNSATGTNSRIFSSNSGKNSADQRDYQRKPRQRPEVPVDDRYLGRYSAGMRRQRV